MTAPTSPRLAVTGGSYAGGVALQIVVQAASLPVLTRLLDPAAYGVTATALVVANLLAVVVDLGTARAVTRAYFRGPDGPGQAGALVTAGLGAVVLLSGLLLLAAPWLGGWLGADGPAVVQAAVLLGAAIAGRNVVLGMLRALGGARGYLAVMVLGTSGAQLLALVVVAARGTAGSYIAGLAAGTLLGVFVGLALLRPRPSSHPGLWRWAVPFGLLLLPGEVAAVAIWFSDRLVLEQLLGSEAVGRYQVAYTLGSVLLMLAMGVSQAWAPALYAAEPLDRAALADRTRTQLLDVGAYAAAALSLAAPVVLLVLIPKSYEPAGLFAVTAVVACCVLPLLAQQAASHLLSGVDRAGVLAWTAVGAAVFNVVATLLLVPVLDLFGAAVATLLTYLLYAAVLTAAAGRLAQARFRFTALPWAVAGAGAVVGSALPATGGWVAVRAVGVVVCAAPVLLQLQKLLAARRADRGPVEAPCR